MNITQFEQQKVYAPFLGSTLSPIKGLDQLGLNLTSERIFDFLLPGLNNVTSRIRYYSFYSWFFDWYSQNIIIISAKEQTKYLRRAEFLLALIAAHNNQGGIPGITKALEIYNASSGQLNLDDGTLENTKNTEGSYWKNPGGVMGQYYISSLKQIGIIKDQGDKPGVYIRTDFKNEDKVSGVQLAQAFEKNLEKKSLDLFIEILKRKTLFKKELETLSGSFNMLKIPEGSLENKLLFQLLINADKPTEATKTFFRKSTVKSLLEVIDVPKNDLRNQFHLPWYAYVKKIKGETEEEETYTLWWLFMLEQFWSISATSILESSLEILNRKNGGSWEILEDFTENLANDISDIIIKEESADFDLSFKGLTLMEQNEFELYYLLKEKHSPEFKIKVALYLIHKILYENIDYRDELVSFSKKHNLHTQSSFLTTSTKLQDIATLPLKDFIVHFLKKYVVYRHHFVSLRKMNASQSSAKFILDNGLIRFIDVFHFDLSSPRIHTVMGFLEDLGIIESETFVLTKNGRNILNTSL